MKTASFGDRHVIRFEPGEQVMPALMSFLERNDVGFSFASGVGGVRRLRLGYWDVERKKYRHRDLDEQLEVLALSGDSSRKDGAPHLHLHGVFGRSDFSTIGGHLVDGEAFPTLELWLRVESAPVRRVHDDATGLDLLDLEGAG
jgi:predicted DNA-binding protein with PD1-like motif